MPLFLPMVACVLANGEEAQQFARLLHKGKWRQQAVRTVDTVEGFRPVGPVELSQYGGWKARRTKATGFFRTEQIDGRWWLVDPEGHLFLTVGLNSVSRKSANKNLSAADRRFGSVKGWANATAALLKARRFNSLGCWSEWRPIREGATPMPYFPRWNFMLHYKNVRDPKDGPRGYPNLCMPLFDDAFEKFCDEHAKQLAATKDDPWLLGHFSDNELPFRPNLLDLYLELPATDSGHRAARAWLRRHRERTGRDMGEKVAKSERDPFLEFAARRYYSIVGRAIRKYDPNHLYLGSRIHGRTIREAVFRGARGHVDVMSVNYYHRWSAEPKRMDAWAKAFAGPFIASEWYAMQLDTPQTKGGGAGFRVPTQRERGLFYQNFTISLLAHPNAVGWHWFKYGGDGDGYSMGVVSRQYEPHADLLDVMQQLNEQVYPLAVHFREGP